MTQDTLTRGYEAFLDGRFTEGTNARAWLLTILTNRFLSDSRQRRRMANVDMETLIATQAHRLKALQASETEQPDVALLATVLDEPLENALAALSEDLRLSIVLVAVEQLSYEEAAAAMQIPVGTVRSRIFRARQQLVTHLQEYAREHRKA